MSRSTPESLSGRTFRSRTFRGSRFVDCDLTDVVVRGSDLTRMELDSPWLLEGGNVLLVNGVDVVPLVDAELDRRFPGRELRGADGPDGLAAAWAALERTWDATLQRADAMPAGTVDATVDGEWSLAQTLRHLVMATDTWLNKAILEQETPYHPIGLAHDGGSDAFDASTFSAGTPTYEEVLEVRAGRQAMVRDFIGTVGPADLAAPRRNPHSPAVEETVLSCLRTILEEEWEHHRYVVRDLDHLAGADAAALS